MLRSPRFLGSLLALSLIALTTAQTARVEAQAQIKPWFLLVVDTSGSMNDSPPAIANSCKNSSGTPYLPADKMRATTCAINNILSSSGDADFGLMQFSQTSGCGTSTCDNTASSALLRVSLSSSGSASILPLVDGSPSPNPDSSNASELCAGGNTPLGGTLAAARQYFQGVLAANGTSPTEGDLALGCRPVSVILLTDGAEFCSSCMAGWSGCPKATANVPGLPCSPADSDCCDPCSSGSFESAPERAYELRAETEVPETAGVNCGTFPTGNASCTQLAIKTYVIGFGITPGNARIERIAYAGGTDAPGPNRGFYADNEAGLSAALTQIILDSQISEVCDGIDNDCDARVDEDFPKYCDINNIRTANPMVTNPLNPSGPLINQADVVGPRGELSSIDNCYAMTGCDVPGVQGNTLCAQPEYTSSSMCGDPSCTTPFNNTTCPAPKVAPNLLCTSPGEVCNIQDDDCDGNVDEGAPAIVGCNDASCEPCDLLDNDCDGLVDEETCPPCFPEICDGLDNDCDGVPDDNLSRSCGSSLGICSAGTQICSGGAWGAINPMTMMFEAALCPSTGPRTCTDPQEVADNCEICNNLDDDCDGVVDDMAARACAPYGTTGECDPGQERCIAGVWQSSQGAGPGDDIPANCIGARGPTSEVCDNQDDDCDGAVDDSATPPTNTIPGTGVTCGNGVGICDPGATVCASAATCPDCVSGTCVGSLSSCMTDMDCPECAPGTIVCFDNGQATSETCNGLDDDCDGKVDEALGMGQNVGVPCFPMGMNPGLNVPAVGECKQGTSACIGGGIVCQGFTGPQPELCDDKDQDCDGFLGDGSDMCGSITSATDPQIGQECGSSVGACNTGTRSCALASPGVCAYDCNDTGPTSEVCNGVDDDCDGAVDDETTAPTNNIPGTDTACDYAFDPMNPGNPLIPEEGLCEHGVVQCIGGQLVCDGAVGPSNEICDCEDNDCDATTDESTMAEPIPGVGDDCGTDVGICEFGTTICDSPGTCALVCPDDVEPLPNELCNGLDDDCDGLTDEGNPEGGGQCGNVGTCRRSTDPTNGSLPLDQPCGECQFGTEVCTATGPMMAELRCVGFVGPEDELCDGLDNDCDYLCLVDNTNPAAPVVKCPASCSAPMADCDAKVDEGVDVTDPRVGEMCGTSTGECDEGSFQCLDGFLQCQDAVGGVPEVCNAKDDDCDGLIDDGIPVGDPCGTDVGECQPGVKTCNSSTGKLVCTGGVQPVDEVCDSLDNDCDGLVDEDLGIGEACGSDVGECKKGNLECVGGKVKCVGETPPGIEVCDCKDNDCDGEIDEETGANPICPGESACVMCQCALPCTHLPEFGDQCPTGKAPVTVDEECRCVGELCKFAECRESTLEVDGVTQCTPDSQVVGPCVCKNNECSSPCTGVVCEGGLVCDPTTGQCEARTCLLPQFACEDGKACQNIDGSWTCVADACGTKECPADEACRGGKCIGSCANVTCKSTEVCVDGTCETNRCADVTCGPGLICNPENAKCVVPGKCVTSPCVDGFICDPIGGECASDPCLVTRCPTGQQCNSATTQCEAICGGGFVFCDGLCIDPSSNKRHCGAKTDCEGSNAGDACSSKEVCSQGTCSDNCQEGSLNCDGECIDPDSDRQHCGASGDCTGGQSGVECDLGANCIKGVCVAGGEPGKDGGPDGDGGVAPIPPDTESRVLAAGGGGCTSCAVIGSAPERASGSRAGFFSLAFVALALLRLRRRAGRGLMAPRGALGRRVVLVAIATALVVLLAGCSVKPFCLTCPQEGDAGGAGGASAGMGAVQDGGGGGGVGGSAGSGTGGVGGMAGGDAGPDTGTGGTGGGTGGGCEPGDPPRDVPELCDGEDNDCDGNIDEDVDPAAQNIDLDTNPQHCGACGHACEPTCALAKCSKGVCGLAQCDVGCFNLDGDDENGCEYRCNKTADEDTRCDLTDDDCDGKVDDEVDLQSDLENCGSCGFECVFIHAKDGGSCDAGDCVLDPTKCDDGFHDIDGLDVNGCEYSCTPADPAVEVCNAQDDDCDMKVDEGVDATDPRVGAGCGTDTGACQAGTNECNGGAVQCIGSIGATDEVCDGVDNDCDGTKDEDDPRLDLPCGNNIGLCERGMLTCEGVGLAKALECTGGTPAASEICDGFDNDCDGKTDENTVADPLDDVGSPCRTRMDGSVEINPGAPTGLCENGTAVCQQTQLKCIGEVKPAPEQCDLLDQDCDGNAFNGVNVTDPDIGKDCGVETGECDFGLYSCNMGVQICTGAVSGGAEVCDGLDNDCDGSFDETNPNPPIGVGLPCIFDDTGTLQYGPSVTATGECSVGTTTCVGGRVACPDYGGPQPELCDDLDQDCDGDPANNLQDVRIGASCDSDGNTTGACNQGSQVCNTAGATPFIECTGETTAAASDLCNGVDEDCNASTADGSDETWNGASCRTLANGSIQLSPPPALGTCVRGSAACVSGTQACLGETLPALETCDTTMTGQPYDAAKDQDCDGSVDEDFSLQTNVANCGICGRNCTMAPNAVPNAFMTCTAGACAISGCQPGYYDDKTQPGVDCDITPMDCTFTGQELCDNVDNDCDGIVDESIMGEPLFLPSPSSLCVQQGACLSSSVECRTHKTGEPDNPTCTAGMDCVTEPVCTVRPKGETCNAPYNMESSATFDEDCDGKSDLIEFGLSGTCTAPGVGACATTGNLACDLTTMGAGNETDTFCSDAMGAPVATGSPGNEATAGNCNGSDDDCDGDVDEACGAAGTVGTCVTDAYVTLPGGSQMFAYEASRPDATNLGSGVNAFRACSNVGKLPWGNLTIDQASAACTAAGARLCTEQEWQQGCEAVTMGSVCRWSYSSACTTYANSTCNGIDFVAPGNDIEPTGWTGTGAMTSNCFRTQAAPNQTSVFDLSGNVKEYTQARLDGALPVRGGANNSPANGMTCQFDFTVWPNTNAAKFVNTGFRCCKGTAPAKCGKFASTDIPKNASGGNDITSTIVVPVLAGATMITDVDVELVGCHPDFEDIDLIRITGPDATSVDLRSTRTCTNNTSGFNLYYDDSASSSTLSCSSSSSCAQVNTAGGGVATRPENFLMAGAFQLSDFNAKAPNGTWTLFVRDATSSSTNSWNLDGWYLKICAQ